MLQFERKLQKCIRLGITIFKIFIRGGKPLDIRSEIRFPNVYPTRNSPNEKFEYSYPLIEDCYCDNKYEHTGDRLFGGHQSRVHSTKPISEFVQKID